MCEARTNNLSFIYFWLAMKTFFIKWSFIEGKSPGFCLIIFLVVVKDNFHINAIFTKYKKYRLQMRFNLKSLIAKKIFYIFRFFVLFFFYVFLFIKNLSNKLFAMILSIN